MKHKIFTASLLALSLLTTGCGGTANTDNTGTNIASSEESGTACNFRSCNYIHNFFADLCPGRDRSSHIRAGGADFAEKHRNSAAYSG